MKQRINRYLPRSLCFGIVMTIIGFFNGKIRYSFDDSLSFPPVWVQLLRLFAIYALVFLAGSILCDYIISKVKKSK